MSCALTAASERGPSTWHRPLIERPIVGSGADDGVRDARHLGGDGSNRLAAEMLVAGLLGDVAAVARPEGVLALADRYLCCQPEGTSQASVAELGQPRLAAEHAGLVCRKVEPAELQELAMMAETTKIAGFGQYGERDDWADAGQLTKPCGVTIAGQQHLGLRFDLVALAYQAAALGEDQPEHRDGRGLKPYRQSYGGSRRLVDIGQQTCLGDLAADQVPRGLHKYIPGQGGDAGRRGKLLEQRQEPIAARVALEPLSLGRSEEHTSELQSLRHLVCR